MISFCPRSLPTQSSLTLGLLVEVSEVLPLLLVDDGEDSGNGLSDSVARGQFEAMKIPVGLVRLVCLVHPIFHPLLPLRPAGSQPSMRLVDRPP
jgi:hypothetical protein